MRYVVANKEKALDAGVLLLGHLVKGESIILNEKEVMCLPSLDGELEDRILLLDGIVYTNTTASECLGQIAGMGKHSYKIAMEAFKQMIEEGQL